MTRTKIDHGICGFMTTITVESKPDYTVEARLDSTCPHIAAIPTEHLTYDPILELSPTGIVYDNLKKFIAHPSCLFISAFLKTGEVEAGLALKKNTSMTFVEDDSTTTS